MAKRFEHPPPRIAEPQPTQRCADCKFWVKTGDGVGECRRFPPLAHLMMPPAPAALKTGADYWCGEFAVKS